MRVRYLQRKDLSKIEPLVANHKFNDYRNHRIFSKEQRVNYVLGEISDSIDNGDYVFIAKDKDNILGLASLINLPWDTKHFGFRMAKIGHLIANESYSKSFKIKNILLSYILQVCKKEAINHISCRIETDDFSSNHCLEQKGFMIMDTLVTYLFIIHKHDIPNFKSLHRIRLFKKEDLRGLITIAKNRFSNTHFHIDPHIPKGKTDLLYAKWIRNCCKRKLADEVFVAEKRNKPVGFFTYKLDNKLLEFTEVMALGRGIAAVLPEAKGGYVNLLIEALKKVKSELKVDLCIFDTQIWNYPVIKIWQKFKMDFVCSKYTFHKWIDNKVI